MDLLILSIRSLIDLNPFEFYNKKLKWITIKFNGSQLEYIKLAHIANFIDHFLAFVRLAFGSFLLVKSFNCIIPPLVAFITFLTLKNEAGLLELMLEVLVLVHSVIAGVQGCFWSSSSTTLPHKSQKLIIKFAMLASSMCSIN